VKVKHVCYFRECLLSKLVVLIPALRCYLSYVCRVLLVSSARTVVYLMVEMNHIPKHDICLANAKRNKTSNICDLFRSLYWVSKEECARLRECVPYVKIYR
jgi:hypothetical protein